MPDPHFLLHAAHWHGLDLRRSFVIGDHPHDVELAHNAGATGIYVLTGHGVRHRAELRSDAVVTANLAAAADWILGRIVDTAPRGFSKRCQTMEEPR
jgi:D-glycero-D-manno-heptose 1,7-bisphosphate phosphatase